MELAGHVGPTTLVTKAAYMKNGVGAFAHPDGKVRLHRIQHGKKYTSSDQPPILVEAGDVCQVSTCYAEIKVMTYRGTGVCSENHRKIRDGEIKPAEQGVQKESALP